MNDTFCDDCGSTMHEWENCPLTLDYKYDSTLDPLVGNDTIDDGFALWDDEPFDIDDDQGMNPYDGTYEDDYRYDDWQSESDLWHEM